MNKIINNSLGIYANFSNKNVSGPSFKGNVSKLPLQNASKLWQMTGYGSVIAIGILAHFGINYNKKMDNNFNEVENGIDGKHLIEEFLENPENEKNNINYRANITYDSELIDDFSVLYGKSEELKNILPKNMHKRIAYAVGELVKIPQFRDKVMQNIVNTSYEVTPQNISFVEKVLNTPKLLNNESLQNNLAEIIHLMNHPRFEKTNCVEEINKLLDAYVNDKNSQFDNIGQLITAKFSCGDFR